MIDLNTSNNIVRRTYKKEVVLRNFKKSSREKHRLHFKKALLLHNIDLNIQKKLCSIYACYFNLLISQQSNELFQCYLKLNMMMMSFASRRFKRAEGKGLMVGPSIFYKAKTVYHQSRS